MVKGKRVSIHDGDSVGVAFSRKTVMSGTQSWSVSPSMTGSPPPRTQKRILTKKGSLRASSSVRRSTVVRQRTASTRGSVYTVQRKLHLRDLTKVERWILKNSMSHGILVVLGTVCLTVDIDVLYCIFMFQGRVAHRAVVSMDPHYEGATLLCYLNLLLQFLLTFLSIWWGKRQISTRVVRQMVVCQIIGLIIIGFLLSTGGVFNISVFSKNTNEYTTDFYWAMTIVSMVVFSLSVMGCIGVFRPNMFITQVYAVVSFICGHLIFSVVLAWYLLVILDTYLSVKYFHRQEHLPNGSAIADNRILHPPLDRSRDNTSLDEFERNKILHYRSDEQIFTDKLLRQYCLMLLFASIIMMSSGVLTTKLLIQVRRKQGYLCVETTNGMPEELPEPSQTQENVLSY